MLMRVPMYRVTQLLIIPMEKEPINRAIWANKRLRMTSMSRMAIPLSTMACVRKGATNESRMPLSMPKDNCTISFLNGHTYFLINCRKLCFSLTDFFS